MQEYREFFVLRFSLVEESQSAMDVKQIPDPKGEAVRVAIEQDREYSNNGVRYTFVGFTKVEPDEAKSVPIRTLRCREDGKVAPSSCWRKSSRRHH